jgi:hypothetical protein
MKEHKFEEAELTNELSSSRSRAFIDKITVSKSQKFMDTEA